MHVCMYCICAKLSGLIACVHILAVICLWTFTFQTCSIFVHLTDMSPSNSHACVFNWTMCTQCGSSQTCRPVFFFFDLFSSLDRVWKTFLNCHLTTSTLVSGTWRFLNVDIEHNTNFSYLLLLIMFCSDWLNIKPSLFPQATVEETLVNSTKKLKLLIQSW